MRKGLLVDLNKACLGRPDSSRRNFRVRLARWVNPGGQASGLGQPRGQASALGHPGGLSQALKSEYIDAYLIFQISVSLGTQPPHTTTGG